MPALIADGLMRRRDERFAGQRRYKALPDPLYDKAASGKSSQIKSFSRAIARVKNGLFYSLVRAHEMPHSFSIADVPSLRADCGSVWVDIGY